MSLEEWNSEDWFAVASAVIAILCYILSANYFFGGDSEAAIHLSILGAIWLVLFKLSYKE